MMSYYLERLNDLYICIYVVYTDISKRGITVKYIVVARVYVCVRERKRRGEIILAVSLYNTQSSSEYIRVNNSLQRDTRHKPHYISVRLACGRSGVRKI